MTTAKPKPLTHDDHAAAVRVIERAREGLHALEDVLDARFSEVVERILSCKGRVVVTGMGKSGHIAKKIAATLASTGTPAMFVHPGEASHGDLGMITRDDVVIFLSNSGETAELTDMVHYCKLISVPMVSVVRRASSFLVQASDFAFVLPEVPEASPVGAPTTSTTMMLVFGDALAMALLERRGLSAEDFQTYHPGGKLGARFIQVQQVMKKDEDVPMVSKTMPMSEVLLTITAKRLGCAAVVEGEKLVGIVTDGDLRRHMQDSFLNLTAAEVMTVNPRTIGPNMLVSEALALMNDKSITVLCVVEDGVLCGMVHIHDMVRFGVR